MGYPLKKDGVERFTWQDYLTWPEEERWEVIGGKAYNMSPSPTERHQRILVNLTVQLNEKLRGTPCRVYAAPLDVYFDDYNFVQPDVFVVCDKNKIKDKIYGAPDLIIEVLSFFTAVKDRKIKKELYEKFGVREYILVHPEENYIEIFLLTAGGYSEPDIIGADEVFKSGIFENLEIPLWEVFEVAKPEIQINETS
ncbi:MAG: Uma2 family endonuclease [Thermodesulfovibrionales bacterium]